MNKTDTRVAKLLLFVVFFALAYKVSELTLSFFFPNLAMPYPYVIYAISFAIAIVAAFASNQLDPCHWVAQIEAVEI